MANSNKAVGWLIDSGLKDAQYWERGQNENTRCLLCPRNCYIQPGNVGFCKARFNDNGDLKTAIWGKLLTPSIEPIETEAVFHFWPGAKILSIGNLGCNLSCDFCQNWESSNLENLSPEFVKYHTPESIVHLAEALGINVLSFTYNDPVIWFEFLYETALLARRKGIATLFKSAAFVSADVAQALTEVIDIFSISLKTMNPKTFTAISKGKLGPVLDAIKIFYNSGRHLEISNLVVPGLTDNLDEARDLARWVRTELADNVPVHFVRFHPCYKYTDVDRTDIGFLEETQQAARDEGLQYVYIGNTFKEGHGDIFCRHCGCLLVKRFGLYTRITGISPDATCSRCGAEQEVVLQPQNRQSKQSKTIPKNGNHVWLWADDDSRNLHLQVKNRSINRAMLVCQHLDEHQNVVDSESLSVPGGGEIRIAVGQVTDEEASILINHSDDIQCEISKLLDRAHFPLEEAC